MHDLHVVCSMQAFGAHPKQQMHFFCVLRPAVPHVVPRDRADVNNFRIPLGPVLGQFGVVAALSH